ncbi:MAG: ABC transporter ATP-binding protein [Alphaproteobacteria bacterium]|nr:ABC transporter ATP-binding protein [Alphaproteobacteria bacterium SS10]
MSSEVQPRSDVVIEAKGLAKAYRIYKRPEDRLLQAIFRRKQLFTQFEALKGVDFEIKRGEAIGVMGRNGSGKSTLLQLLAGTLTPTGGTCQVHGRIAALLELGAGFNPDFTGEENIYLNAAVLGLSREEIDAKYAEIVEFSEIGDFLDRPVKTYSTGMYMRLAFAVAIAVEPEVLIVDEALSVGDEAFQRKCFTYLHGLLEKGSTLLFVSHAAVSVVELCSRALLLHQGELVLDDSPRRVVQYYQRLLYDRGTDNAALIEEIRAQAAREAAAPQPEPEPEQAAVEPEQVDPNAPEPYYDPGFISSTMNEYVPNGGRISDPHITTPGGKRVNHLIHGQRYTYRFRVDFDEANEGVQFGMYIRTKRGIDLGGSPSHGPDEEKLTVKPGDLIEVRFDFVCSMLTGTYFINAGCSAMKDGTRTSVHRIIDAMMFKVITPPGVKAEGIVDLGINAVTQALGKAEATSE